MKKYKERLIHWLGGKTDKEVSNEVLERRNEWHAQGQRLVIFRYFTFLKGIEGCGKQSWIDQVWNKVVGDYVAIGGQIEAKDLNKK